MDATKLRSTGIAMVCAFILICLNSRSVPAQYVVSARGGLVNYTGTDVQLLKAGETDWVQLEKHQQLADGDQVRTGDHSRAEILLNPGSYLRLNNATVVEFLHTDFPVIAFKLNSGSAIVEAGELSGAFRIMAHTPQSTVRIEKDGLYRIDSRAELTELAVHKGEAVVQGQGIAEKKIGKDRYAKLLPNKTEFAKLENVGKDEFDYWSQDRAETLIASNRALVRRSGFYNGWCHNQWAFDSLFGNFTFLPCGRFYYSPYFSGYAYWCPLYGSPYWQHGYSGYWGPGFSGGGGSAPPRERLGKAIYALSPKDPGSPIHVGEPASFSFGGDRFSHTPIHSAAGGSGGYSMGSASSHSAPTATGHAVAPIGRGKN